MENQMKFFERISSKCAIAARVAIAAAAMFASQFALADLYWNWRMPGDIYGGLDFETRVGVDKASKCFSDAINAERNGANSVKLIPLYRAAVAEWRKVEIQAEADNTNDDLLAYAAFMQGYARFRAHDTNEAVKFFNQVVDLYEDIEWVVFPAKYFIARVKLDTGEMRTGWNLYEEIFHGDEGKTHPLMANVANSLGWKKWEELKEAEAQEAWTVGASEHFANSNWRARNASVEGLLLACVIRGAFDDLENFLFAGVKEENTKRRREVVYGNADWFLWQITYGHSALCKQIRRKCKSDSECATKTRELHSRYVEWFEGKRNLLVVNGDDFHFCVKQIKLRLRLEKRDKITSRILALASGLGKIKDDKARASRVRTVIDLFYDLNDFDSAFIVADKMPGAGAAAYLRYEIAKTAAERGKGKWDDCIPHLKEYLNTHPESSSVLNAKYIMGWIYRERMGDAKKALEVYLDITDPPKSLWELAWTYRKLGEKSKAENTLTEIASLFEKDAPRAVLTLAQYAEADGNRKKAVALYKRLLSQPEWKKLGESSQAHQALERLGERTGGAMINEVH